MAEVKASNVEARDQNEARESSMGLGYVTRSEEIKGFVRIQSPSRSVRSRGKFLFFFLLLHRSRWEVELC